MIFVEIDICICCQVVHFTPLTVFKLNERLLFYMLFVHLRTLHISVYIISLKKIICFTTGNSDYILYSSHLIGKTNTLLDLILEIQNSTKTK
jgi:hypothetical protein